MQKAHNNIKQVHDGFFPKKESEIENVDTLHLFLEKFIVHNLSAPHKWGIPKLKNCAHVLPSPTYCNQGFV